MDNQITIGQALWWAIEKFKRNQIESAQIDAELLLCRVLGTTREVLYMTSENELEEEKYFLFEKLVAQRLMRVPVAYILQEKYFFGLKFVVNENVLIPRPETEELVISSLEQINNITAEKKEINILEIGTGSGAVIVSLAQALEKTHLKDRVNFFASDKSSLALDVAKINIERHNLTERIFLFHSDLLKEIPEYIKFEIIVANLPYLDRTKIEEYSPEIKYEPSMALFAEEKGKKIYYDLFAEIKAKKLEPIVIAECSQDQEKELKIAYDNLITIGV
ncbi:MAG: peptide chain release factor N(5)-glutamine methyltransferase [Patescibacteria group bacterium]